MIMYIYVYTNKKHTIAHTHTHTHTHTHKIEGKPNITQKKKETKKEPKIPRKQLTKWQ